MDDLKPKILSLSHYVIPETSGLPYSSAPEKKKIGFYFYNCSQKINKAKIEM